MRVNLRNAYASLSKLVRTEYFVDLFSENHLFQSENGCSISSISSNLDFSYSICRRYADIPKARLPIELGPEGPWDIAVDRHPLPVWVIE